MILWMQVQGAIAVACFIFGFVGMVYALWRLPIPKKRGRPSDGGTEQPMKQKGDD